MVKCYRRNLRFLEEIKMETNEFERPQSDAELEAQALLEEKPKENVLLGIVGALLFSLAGTLTYFILYQLGYLAALSGIVAVICAMYGYKLFAKGESKKTVVIAVIMSFLAIVLAWYGCLAKDVYDAYAEWYQSGEIDYAITFGTAFSKAYIFLDNADVARPYYTDLVMSLFLSIIGCVGMFVRSNSGKKTKSKDKTE